MLQELLLKLRPPIARPLACVGIGLSPASVGPARTEARSKSLPCEYRLQDFREGQFGSGFQAALLIFGEFNAFPRDEAVNIFGEVRRALAPGGALVLEVHTEAAVRKLGQQDATWFTARQGLFSQEPHLCLHEASWSEKRQVATEQYFVVELATGEVTQYASTAQAYSDAEYESLLREQGFGQLERYGALDDSASNPDEGLFVLVGRAVA